MRLAFAGIALLALLAAPARADDSLSLAPGPRPGKLVVEAPVARTAAEVAALARKLGVPIAGAATQTVSIDTTPVIELNELSCSSEAEAAALFDELESLKPSDMLGRKGRHVVEIVVRVRSLWLAGRWLKHELGLPPDEARVTASCIVSPLASGDAVAANDVFNLSLKGIGATEAEVKARAAGFTFADELRLNDAKRSYYSATYSTKPAATATRADDVLRLKLPELEKWFGIPKVELRAELTARDCYEPVDAGARDRLADLIKPTTAWPSGDDQLVALAKKIAGDKTDPLAKVAALHAWVYENVRYGGPVGCRCGVKKALANRLGPCWDKSDVFVTLCRAQKIPCRQLAGWAVGPRLGRGLRRRPRLAPDRHDVRLGGRVARLLPVVRERGRRAPRPLPVDPDVQGREVASTLAEHSPAAPLSHTTSSSDGTRVSVTRGSSGNAAHATAAAARASTSLRVSSMVRTSSSTRR